MKFTSSEFVLISLARVVLFRGIAHSREMTSFPSVLISLARVVLFREGLPEPQEGTLFMS